MAEKQRSHNLKPRKSANFGAQLALAFTDNAIKSLHPTQNHCSRTRNRFLPKLELFAIVQLFIAQLDEAAQDFLLALGAEIAYAP